jgi:hypothetical protein
MLKACLRQLKFDRLESEVNQVFVAVYMQEMESNRNQRMEKADVMERKRAIYDNLDVYLRNYFYAHLSKASLPKLEVFSLWSTFKVGNLFKQILSFGSYKRYFKQLSLLVRHKVFPSEQEKALLLLI